MDRLRHPHPSLKGKVLEGREQSVALLVRRSVADRPGEAEVPDRLPDRSWQRAGRVREARRAARAARDCRLVLFEHEDVLLLADVLKLLGSHGVGNWRCRGRCSRWPNEVRKTREPGREGTYFSGAHRSPVGGMPCAAIVPATVGRPLRIHSKPTPTAAPTNGPTR
jgi:hypothetical protein